MNSFVHLHVHTAYSLLDGAIRINKLVDKAKEFNMDSVAVTDHGNMFGVFPFYKAALKAGIKPIVGCETYLAPKGRARRDPKDPRNHLILLAQDYQGYQNLSKLVTKANLEGFYYKPRIDMEILEEHNQGLIALSACLSGHIPALILAGREEEAVEATREMLRIFDDRFYLELQRSNHPEQDIVNKELIKIGAELGVPLVATNDCHYLERQDNKSHDVLLCIQTGKTVDDPNRLRFNGPDYYFKSPDEMAQLFSDVPEAVSNSLKIAERCNLEIPTGNYHFPVFPLKEGQSLDSQLRQDSNEGLEKRLEVIRKKQELDEEQEKIYRDRLEHELKVIIDMEFPGYLLIVADFIKFARENDIPVGPGRGSAAGSLVCYALGITDIDPLPYGLLFERFLNVERISMPDIDIDLCGEGRDRVIQYVSDLYGGSSHVAQIITFGQMQARAAIRDVGRALGMPYGDVDKIAKMIPNVLGISLEGALRQEPKLQEAADMDPRVARLLESAMALEGLPRHASTHAAGVVIGDKPLVEYLPLYSVSSKAGEVDQVVTQFDMKGVEEIGLIKFDFLGLKTLTLIDYAVKLLKSRGIDIDLLGLDLDDKKTYDLLSAGDTTGIFQLESDGMRELLRKAGPDCFEDIIALVALYRPGPLERIDGFVDNKAGRAEIVYELPILEPVLRSTYGIIIYQEQVMEIAARAANYSLGEADILRRAMGKKDPVVMAQQRQRFMEGIKENNFEPAKGKKIFDLMEKFAGYGFNKSHSAAYALIAFQTAYLKANHPIEFMASLLSNEVNNMDKIVRLMSECRSAGLDVLPPDINQSGVEFSVVEGKIRFGLAAIKGLGRAAIEAIIDARSDGPFTDMFDLAQRVDLRRVNRKVLEALIKCGAFDTTGAKRSQMAAGLEDALDSGARVQRDRESGQSSLFETLDTTTAEPELQWADIPEWSESQLLNFEKESLGFYISGHPLARYEIQLASMSSADTEKIQTMSDKAKVTVGGAVVTVDQINTKKGDRMAFVTIEDMVGRVEVIVFPEIFQTSQHLLVPDTPLFVTGEVTLDEKGGHSVAKIIANKITPLEDVTNKQVAEVRLNLSSTDRDQENLEELKRVLARHQGDIPAVLNLSIPGKGTAVVKLKQGIEPRAAFIQEARKYLKQVNVRFIYQ